jgi:hypothetical protein
LRLPQHGGPGSCIYFPPGTRWPSYTPQALGLIFKCMAVGYLLILT